MQDPDFAPAVNAPPALRHTLDVRLAQTLPGWPAQFTPSVQVSQYVQGTPPTPVSVVNPFTDPQIVQQLQVNPPNLPMFQTGTVPFFGDYIDIAGPTFVPQGTGWRFNIQSQDPDTTRVVWTDNRNVVQPADGDWTHYTPVNLSAASTPSVFDPTQNRPACLPGQAGMRNQDIFTAQVSQGPIITAKNTFKPLDPALQRAFPVSIQNTQLTDRTYSLTLNPPPGVNASFAQTGPALQSIVVVAPALSSISRNVYATLSGSAVPTQAITVSITDTGSPANSTTVIINGDVSNPNIANPNIANPNIANPNIANVEVYTPNIANPNIANPNIANPNIANPNIANPNIANPNIANMVVANPNIANPNIANPNIANPNIANPNIANPNIANPNIANESITDVSYNLTNYGNTSTTYTLQTLTSQAPPAGVIVQVIVSKVSLSPTLASVAGANSCQIAVTPTYYPVININNAALSDVANAGNPTSNDASVSVAPNETVLVTIRLAGNLGTYQPLQALAPVVIAPATSTKTPGGTPPPPTIALQLLPAVLPAATASGQYTAPALKAIGGTPGANGIVYSWSMVTPGSWLTISNTGVLSGIAPAGASGPYNFTVQVSDGTLAVTRPFTVLVNPAPAITALALPATDQGLAYPSQQLQVTGGTAPFGPWSATGLPANLNLSAAGVLSGTVASAVNTSFQASVTDANGVTATRAFNLVVNAPLQILTGSLSATETTAPYSVQLTSAGGTAPLGNWSFTGSLPLGLQLSQSGLLSGVASQTGPANFTVSISDAAGATATRALSIQVGAGPSLQPATFNASTGANASFPLSVTNGTAPFTYSITSGSLPPAMQLSGGTISGAPNQAGSYAFTVSVSDALKATASANYTINVSSNSISSTQTLPPGFPYAPYGPYQMVGPSQGLYWSSNNVPDGLQLSSGGSLSGSPTTPGTTQVLFQYGSDSFSPGSFTLPLTVVGPSVNNITNIKLNGVATQHIAVLPGAQIQVTVDYNIYNGNYCPSCIRQVAIGFAGQSQAQACAYNGIPTQPASGTGVSVTVTAPSTPGRYYLSEEGTFQYSCGPWNPNDTGAYFAQVDVVYGN